MAAAEMPSSAARALKRVSQALKPAPSLPHSATAGTGTAASSSVAAVRPAHRPPRRLAMDTQALLHSRHRVGADWTRRAAMMRKCGELTTSRFRTHLCVRAGPARRGHPHRPRKRRAWCPGAPALADVMMNWSERTSPRSLSRSGSTATVLRPCQTITCPRCAAAATGPALDLRVVGLFSPCVRARGVDMHRQPRCVHLIVGEDHLRPGRRPALVERRIGQIAAVEIPAFGRVRAVNLAAGLDVAMRAPGRARLLELGNRPAACSTACSPCSCGPRQSAPCPSPSSPLAAQADACV